MKTIAISIRRGATADIPIRIETEPLSYVAITNIARTAPCRITAPLHGLPNGWRAAIQNAGGLTELNVPWDRLREADLREITRIDADTLDLPGVNSQSFRPYTAGGQLAYYPPLDLTAYTGAAMDVRAEVDGPLLASYTTANARLELDATNAALWLRLSAADTLLLESAEYVFDIELTAADASVDALCAADSTLMVWPEVTTS